MNLKNIFKGFIAGTFLLLFFLPSIANLILLVDFEINRAYIAKELCENKSRPEKHCAGKCYLKKNLEKENTQKQTPLRQLKDDLFNKFFFDHPGYEPLIISEKTNTYNPLKTKTSAGNLSGVFHPPAC